MDNLTYIKNWPRGPFLWKPNPLRMVRYINWKLVIFFYLTLKLVIKKIISQNEQLIYRNFKRKTYIYKTSMFFISNWRCDKGCFCKGMAHKVVFWTMKVLTKQSKLTTNTSKQQKGHSTNKYDFCCCWLKCNFTKLLKIFLWKKFLILE